VRPEGLVLATELWIATDGRASPASATIGVAGGRDGTAARLAAGVAAGVGGVGRLGAVADGDRTTG
jgi:hypothetical protein